MSTAVFRVLRDETLAASRKYSARWSSAELVSNPVLRVDASTTSAHRVTSSHDVRMLLLLLLLPLLLKCPAV